ncbi:MAG: glycosyltransferase family 4 protein [Planctomycetes bacterium]|nr:glycosyltransferase family 4 protein [Planctomycetota bacterium]
MRIALFSWESLDAVIVGGVGVHVSELARALARRDHEVHLFTGTTRGDQQHYERVDDVFVHRCGYERHNDFLYEMWNMCRSFEHHFFTTRALTGEFDIVHAHDWMTAEVISLIRGQCTAKHVLTIHSTEFGRCGNRNHGGPSETVRHAEWQGIYLAERVICVSQALKNEIGWLYQAPADKVAVVYNGVRPERFDFETDLGEIKLGLGIHPLAPTFLFAGRIVYQKGVDLLIDAIPSVLKHVPTAMFVFAGDGEMRWDLEARTRSTGLEHNTRWLGKVEPDRLRAYFKACDAVVVPSRNEPFGIVILEAWSAKKPVVATKNGGPGEFVDHGVDGFSIFDTPESIAWGIGNVMVDWTKSKQMGLNGRKKVEASFTWDRIASQVEDIYRT